MNLYLDSYCERAGQAALWSEPLNAISNIAFIISAILAFRTILRLKPVRFADGYLLCALLLCIGFGSFLWHMLPNSTTVMMDVIPITLFINIYLLAFLRRGFGWQWGHVAFGFLMLQLLNGAATFFFDPNTLHGTIMYLPTYAMLLSMVAYSQWKHFVFARNLLNITLLWSLSLLCRTIDIPTCALLPIGTHFLWHILNAVVLYKLLQLLILTKKHSI